MEDTTCDPRCWKCLRGHNDITTLSFHPLRNDRFVTGSLDKTVRAWRLDTCTKYESVKAHKAGIFDVCYSPDGELIASASGDRSIRVRSSEARHYFAEFRAHGFAVRSVQFNPSGDKFVSASDDTTVKLWIPFLGNFFKMFMGHTSSVRCAKFSPDGKLLISCSDDKTIKIWDITSERCIKTFKHKKASRYVEFHPTGTTIGSANVNGCVKLYDLRTNSLYQHFAVHAARVNMIKFHPNGNFMLTASDDSTMKILDLLKGCPIYTLMEHSKKVTCIAFSNDGKLFASSGSDRRIRIWKSNNLCEDGRVSDIPQLTSIEQELDDLNEESYSNEREEDTHILDLLKSRSIYTLEGHSDNVTCITFSNDGKLFASSGPDRRIRIWESNNLCEDGRVSDIPQLTSIGQKLDDLNEESYSNEREKDTHVKQDQANVII
ncbi:POC1 centriolar protein like protein A [Trachymyrmex zeteki]|uniref:POC1 centriolar protein like protein A n=1 Tax=Mycetomoellerius zeteki TaxID=64791 RepID=A0A151WSH2_9HYME|nr:POC1 centriolar protein like protein A [Trachymyrmex zeteki]